MATPVEPKYRQRVGYQAMLLGGFATFASIFLVSGNMATKDAIAERLKEDLLESLNQVVPAKMYDNDLLQEPLVMRADDTSQKEITIYRGTMQSEVSALAWEISEQGYAGEIRLIMGVGTEGQILGVRVISHAETPGLGDKIEPEKDDWILDFNGLSLGNPAIPSWKVKKDGGQFDAFSGATITPRAVVKAIKNGLQFFQQNREQLLSIADSTTHSPADSAGTITADVAAVEPVKEKVDE
jgi:electron transport complex protein RnfG